MNAFIRNGFLLLVLLQAAHATEEYSFALYDRLPYFVWMEGAAGPVFGIVNVLFVALCVWAYLARVSANAPSARAWVWVLALIEIANGILHPTWTLLAGAYVPGTFTAPLLLLVGLALVWRLQAQTPARA